jgi:hypothetical protein
MFLAFSVPDFEDNREGPQTRLGRPPSIWSDSPRQYPLRLRLVERDGALELRRPDARVDLGRVDLRVAEERADFLQVVPLLQDLEPPRRAAAHAAGVPGAADQPAVGPAESRGVDRCLPGWLKGNW